MWSTLFVSEFISASKPACSAAICSARLSITQVITSRSTLRSLPEGRTFEAPLAKSNSVSLVDISPSTLSELNERSVAGRSISARSSALATTSVITKASVVAMFG